MWRRLPEAMRSNFHSVYIIGSVLSALIGAMGMFLEMPAVYGIVPGLIGGVMAVVATVRFLRDKADLAGFVATTCGFVYYQAYQANPVMLPNFTISLVPVAPFDRILGLFLGNLTTAMLLVSCRVVSLGLRGPLRRIVPAAAAVSRQRVDRPVFVGFIIIFAVVAVPNVLFGNVVVGALNNILYQRAAWSETSGLSGFTTFGGALGSSIGNIVLWSTSCFLLWTYLLRSRYRVWMLWVGPLVLLWTASVALSGSRTYLVTLAFGLVVYFLGSPQLGKKAYLYLGIGGAVMIFLLQTAAFYRTEGLQAINLGDLGARIFEIQGNEGTSSQIDGIEFFRTQYWEKGAAPNPALGLVRGLLQRPIEGVLMPVPRSIFPWKPLDETATEFNLYFQNVRLGVASDVAFLGASPGLMGRELIRYGIFGPLTVLFWLGLVLALADRLYRAAPKSDFHRIFATVLIAFLVAQMRDWVPVWFLPFLPAIVILGLIARRAARRYRKKRPKRSSDPVPDPLMPNPRGAA